MVDDLLFTENDLGCCVDITSTKDGKFITINSNSRASSEEGLFPISFHSLSFIVTNQRKAQLTSSWLTLFFYNFQVYVMDAANYENGLMPVRKRAPGVQYFLEHHYGFFYILTNAPSENITFATEGYHLVRCRAEKSSLSTWQVSFLAIELVLSVNSCMAKTIHFPITL